jgi:septal ring factor EnvC (AmiA/AmiB activator)
MAQVNITHDPGTTVKVFPGSPPEDQSALVALQAEQIASLQADLASRDAQIATSAAEIAALQADVASRDARLAELTPVADELATLRAKVSAFNDALEALK